MLAYRKDVRCRFLLIVLMSTVCWAGCSESIETSNEAVSLPLLDRDSIEEGSQIEGTVLDREWSGWRGYNAQGIGRTGLPPVDFSGSHGYAWKVPVPSGNSSPVVCDDRVIITAALEHTDPPTLVVLCYDRATGRERWRAEAGRAVGETHKKNGYASASVATDGQQIVAFFGSTGLICFDFEGNRLWQTKLGDLEHQWGTATSPVLFEDTVIQVCDSHEDSYVAAFAMADGKRRWKTSLPITGTATGSWGTPAFVEADVDGKRRVEMIVNGASSTKADGRMVIAYDPHSGTELWRARGTTEIVSPTPLVSGGLVYSLSGRNGPIMAIRPGGSGDVTESHVVWKRGRGGPYVPSGIVYRNRLFLVTDNGGVSAYNAGNGERIWQERVRGLFTASLVAAGGNIYATSEQGDVYVFAAKDTFELLATNDMESRHCYATPAIVDGDLFLRTETHLYCVAGSPGRQSQPSSDPDKAESASDRPTASPEPHPTPHPFPTKSFTVTPVTLNENNWPVARGDWQASGIARTTLPEKLERLWTFSVEDGRFESTAVIDNGTVVADCSDGKLYAIDLATGEKRWEFTTELGFGASGDVRNGLAAAGGGAVYVGDFDGIFYSLDIKTGKPRWTYPTDGMVISCPTFYQGRVLFASDDGTIHCLDPATGKPEWTCEIDDSPQSSVAVGDDHGFVVGCGGLLYVIDLAAGKSTRQVKLGPPTICTPSINGDMAYMGTMEYQLLAVDWKTEKIAWEFRNQANGNEFRCSPAVTPDAVIAGSRDGLVYAIDRKSGEERWAFPTQGDVDSSPVVVGNRVFFGSGDGSIYGLDLKTGKEVWSFEAGGAILASPAVAAGRMVIGTDEGDLYCFGKK